MRHLHPDAPVATHRPVLPALSPHAAPAGDLPDEPHPSVSITTVLHELRPWFRARIERGIGLVPGGAERWVAVELCAWLNQASGHHPWRIWDIELGAGIHLNAEHRVAMLFNRRATPDPRGMIAMGIRVQSLLATPGRFAQGVDAEVGRLQPASLRVPFNCCQRFVLALAMDPGGFSALRARGFETLAAGPQEMTMLWREVGG